MYSIDYPRYSIEYICWKPKRVLVIEYCGLKFRHIITW